MLKNSTILITGGTGSLGQELVKQLLEHNPRAIRVFDHSEHFLYEMQRHFTDSRLRFLIGDVRDKDRLHQALGGVDIVIHTAALKHVALCEYNPMEAVKTNVLGTMNIINAAMDNKVARALAISSDKAVHSINLYGSTKHTMEKLFIHSNVYGSTKFSCIRFGNFEASRGSVLPLWKEQKTKGEITLTDKDMTRFWISLGEAAEFTIQCLEMMEGGEIFIPKIPEKKLAEIIEEVAPNVKIRVTGKRPGEKLHEMLWSEDENDKIEDRGDYFIVRG